MPRLVGKQSNSGLSVGLFLLISMGVLVTLEYAGTIDVVPNFGTERESFQGNRVLGAN